MEIRIISFSANGCRKGIEISERLEALENQGYTCRNFVLRKYLDDGITEVWNCGLEEWTRKSFRESDGIVFVGALGIAVRAIAPFLKHKTEDPAVIVVDELGKYSISLLSGHLGGANKLSSLIAELINAEAIITTATDINNRFAVDTFAKDNDLYITDMAKAKEISSSILAGEKICLLCDYEIETPVPPYIVLSEHLQETGQNIYIGEKRESHQNCLNLIPRKYVLGLGCKRGKILEDIDKAVTEAVCEAGIDFNSIGFLATVDLKKDEEGIRRFCRKYKIKTELYTADQLNSVQGQFDSSEFVNKTVGVDNVCERAAVKAACGGSLILPKQAKDGVTVAIAVKNKKEIKIRFE